MVNDIVSVLTTINGMNDVDVDNTDVVNTATGFGNVEIMAGSSGATTKTDIGDLVNTIGAIQGFWYNYDIANVNVHLGDADNASEGAEDLPDALHVDDGTVIVKSPGKKPKKNTS